MIKTVIFDLGKVIIPFDFTRGYRGLEQVCGIPAAEIPQRIGVPDWCAGSNRRSSPRFCRLARACSTCASATISSGEI
jgi:hypothetical protein